METEYETISKYAEDIQQHWESKEKAWLSVDLATNIKDIDEIPDKPGIYRLILKTGKINISGYTVCGMVDATITGTLTKGIILSVGKTKHLKTRIKQHFGNCIGNNRLKRRLESIGIKVEEKKIPEECLLQYCPIENWWERDLLEAYGRAISGALFDLEFEH